MNLVPCLSGCNSGYAVGDKAHNVSWKALMWNQVEEQIQVERVVCPPVPEVFLIHGTAVMLIERDRKVPRSFSTTICASSRRTSGSRSARTSGERQHLVCCFETPAVCTVAERVMAGAAVRRRERSATQYET